MARKLIQNSEEWVAVVIDADGKRSYRETEGDPCSVTRFRGNAARYETELAARGAAYEMKELVHPRTGYAVNRWIVDVDTERITNPRKRYA